MVVLVSVVLFGSFGCFCCIFVLLFSWLWLFRLFWLYFCCLVVVVLVGSVVVVGVFFVDGVGGDDGGDGTAAVGGGIGCGRVALSVLVALLAFSREGVRLTT